MLITFCPKIDGEKWCRKNYFKITPCGKMIIVVTEFLILRKNLSFHEVRKNEFPGSPFPYGGISKYFSPSFLGQNFYFWIQFPF